MNNNSFSLTFRWVSLLLCLGITACSVKANYINPIELSSVVVSPTPTPTPTPAPSIQRVSIGDNIQKVSAGGSHTCALLLSGQVKCWGNNNFGQLGYDDTTQRGDSVGSMTGLAAVNLGAGRTAKDITTGQAFTCAILDTNQVKCWGRNLNGQLGQDDFLSRGNSAGSMASLNTLNLGAGRTAKQISAGDIHVCVILDTNDVKCWGSSGDGQLGYDVNDNRGDAAGEMAALGIVNLGVGRTATKIAAGGISTCAILDTGEVKCWGFNGEGHLGTEDWDNRADGAAAHGGNHAYDMANVTAINLGVGKTALDISINSTHTCAVLNDNTVKCWGASYWGEIGYEDYTWRGGNSGEMAALTAVNLGAGRTAKRVLAGGTHTCAILDNDQVKCWGDNSSGQLGYNDTTERGSSAGTMGNSLPAVDLGSGRTAKAISLGYNFTCALLDTDDVKCWGDNSTGQLGQEVNAATLGAASGATGMQSLIPIGQ